MANQIIKKICEELAHYGISETFCHIKFRLKKTGKSYIDFLKKREGAIGNASLERMRDEIQFLYQQAMGQEANLDDPTLFTEKIQWLKVYDSTEEKTKLADKLLVRDWVTKKIGADFLVPLVQVWDSAADIRELSEAVCIKANHGSGMNYIVKDWSCVNLNKLQSMAKEWMETPFWALAIEPHYKDIPRRLIAEQYIEEMDGNLYDYKIHCFGGKPIFIQCIGNRDLEKHTGFQNNYDMQWNRLDWIFEDYPEFPFEVPRPKCLKEMENIARVLSEPFRYVRVDLYEVSGKVMFGEMTFTPAGGTYPYYRTWTKEKDLELGKLIELA